MEKDILKLAYLKMNSRGCLPSSVHYIGYYKYSKVHSDLKPLPVDSQVLVKSIIFIGRQVLIAVIVFCCLGWTVF